MTDCRKKSTVSEDSVIFHTKVVWQKTEKKYYILTKYFYNENIYILSKHCILYCQKKVLKH